MTDMSKEARFGRLWENLEERITCTGRLDREASSSLAQQKVGQRHPVRIRFRFWKPDVAASILLSPYSPDLPSVDGTFEREGIVGRSTEAVGGDWFDQAVDLLTRQVEEELNAVWETLSRFGQLRTAPEIPQWTPGSRSYVEGVAARTELRMRNLETTLSFWGTFAEAERQIGRYSYFLSQPRGRVYELPEAYVLYEPLLRHQAVDLARRLALSEERS